MKLSLFFDSDEFGTHLSAQGMNNYYLLCLFALNHVRERFGVIKITSGFRTEEHNRQIGGVPTSQHVFAEACDFVCPYAESMGLVYRFILDELKWCGECFYYKKRGHIHLALPRLGLSMEQMIFEDK